MMTSLLKTKTWLCVAAILGLLVALPTGALAQPSADAIARLAAALPQGVSPDDATVEQLAAAVAAALTADGITPALAGEIVEYALRRPAIQGLEGEAIVQAVLLVMNSALDAAPPEPSYVDAITMATVFVVPALAVEINAERVRRNFPPLPNDQIDRIVRQPFVGNPPENRLAREAANPPQQQEDEDENQGQQPPAQQPPGASTPTPTPTPAPSALPPPPVDQPMTPVQNPGPTLGLTSA